MHIKDNRSDKSNPKLYPLYHWKIYFLLKNKIFKIHIKRRCLKEKKRKTIKRNILVGIRETKRSKKECGSNDH